MTILKAKADKEYTKAHSDFSIDYCFAWEEGLTLARSTVHVKYIDPELFREKRVSAYEVLTG